jgi:hypothetical protein
MMIGRKSNESGVVKITVLYIKLFAVGAKIFWYTSTGVVVAAVHLYWCCSSCSTYVLVL